MFLKKQNLIILAVGVCLFLIDQFLKFQSLFAWQQSRLIVRFFGWEPFLNPGIAFSIPMPYWLTLTLSAPLIILLMYLLIHQLRAPLEKVNLTNTILVVSLTLILAGALSNSFDRLFRHNTVDYLRIFTGIINLADVFIVSGIIGYLIQENLKSKLQS